ncbi:MAG: L-seryl-tRNA(Sec) selenium transferase [Firmicutes bacterium]|nr:L-seryl-tRNA(Sec) selenium transferase [Bacillota bacterium]
MSNLFRHIPAVDQLLENPQIIHAASSLSKTETTTAIREGLVKLRQEIAHKQLSMSSDEIVSRLALDLENCRRSKFQPVINATGVLLHTNLGRAPLPQEALERISNLGDAYFNLELDLASGERGSRYTAIAKLFNLLLAEAREDLDTVVVNNNAGAVLVALKALTAGQEVIVSRGQLVEIGGGFRVPEVMASSGCYLKEVGTTNRTRLSDYERAITPETKAILLVHPSNYAIVGFTETVARADLAKLANERGLLLIEDIGSGAFTPFSEPLVCTAVRHSHIVTYSGDKLFGGPQAGIISGRKDLINIIKKDPLLRALRIDKLSLLALEAVLELHLDKAYHKLPLWAMASLPSEEVKARAEKWLSQLGQGLVGEVVPSHSTMGGGSLPGETIPSWALALTSNLLSSQELISWFRQGCPAIMGRIEQNRVLLDPRTVLPSQEEALVNVLRRGVTPCS